MGASIIAVLRKLMHAEVDNEEGSTICLYKSMSYKMYGIM